jgi:hypothetical protein
MERAESWATGSVLATFAKGSRLSLPRRDSQSGQSVAQIM